MTREEAIDWLARLKSNTVNHTLDMPLWWNEPLAEALDMAIKALEQESILDNCIEIPKGATNGDMFVAVWGYAPSQLRAQVDWWNAPYKKVRLRNE